MRRIVGLLVIPIGACFAEPDPGVGDDDDGEATSTSGTESEGTGTSAGPASGSGSQSGASASMTTVEPGTATSDTSDSSVDTGPLDTGPTECGMLGQTCCGDMCDEGACWNGRCVVFAGMYAEPETCKGCIEDANGPDGIIPPPIIPYLGMCGCPFAFDTSEEVPTTSDYCPEPMLLHTPTNLRFCQVDPMPEASDWRGVYATSTDPACQVDGDCIVPNLYTGECNCPGTEVEVLAETFANCNGAEQGDHSVHIHICIAPDVEPINFGGAYQTRWIADQPPFCEAGNPLMNNTCFCPDGFSGEPLRITSPESDQGGDLFVCMRY